MGIRNHTLGQTLLHYSSWHRPGSKPNIFIFSTPRSGSTWIKELIGSQPGVRFCNEPFNLRIPHVEHYFSTNDWSKLYADPTNPRVFEYLDSIHDDGRDTAFFKAFPFRKHYRLTTDRIVLKVLHALEDRMGEVEDRYRGLMVLLLRHPLAVSTSRKSCPRLSIFLSSPYARHFSSEQLSIAKSLVNTGSPLEKLVLSWCLQNAVMLNKRRPHWLVMTYEQLTLDSDTMVDHVCDRLDLDNRALIKERLGRASGSSNQSDPKTQDVLSAGRTQDGANFLVEKWRNRVTPEQEQHLMAMLPEFGIDAYTAGDLLPAPHYWVNTQRDSY